MPPTRRSSRLKATAVAPAQAPEDPEEEEIDQLDPSSEPDSPLPESGPERVEKVILRIKRKVYNDVQALAEAGQLSWSSEEVSFAPDELDVDTDTESASVTAKRARSLSVATDCAYSFPL
jgi:hypothetical protein